ncbi:STY0301 family protein [Lysobacter antibioticus]|uniref:STY0301 family protein n=1 Tax=Lysobacter antibioticus TaxID=84531 RepID=UPI003CCE3240
MSISAVALAVGIQIAGCPPVIEDTQSVIPVSGWSISVYKHSRPLKYVTLYVGEPAKRRSLMPAPGRKRGTQTWGFGKTDTWVECEYTGSAATLTRNLGVVKSCDFTPHQGGLTEPAKLVCEK